MLNTVSVFLVFWIIYSVHGDCGVPPTVPNSINNGSGHTHPHQQYHVIVYTCDDMYLPTGNPVFVCRDGVWANTGMGFRCRLRECQFVEVRHGRVVLESYTVASTARVICDAGYELHGPSEMICLSNGDWTETPICEVIYCQELPEMDHLIRFQANEGGDFNDYASVVTSRCDNGYRLFGSSVSICQEDGTWSGEPAYCERINCGLPNVGGGSVSMLTDTYYGGFAAIRCDSGFELVGEDTLFCGEDGWDGGYCYGNCIVDSISHGNPRSTVLREGQQLFWECDNGFIQYPGSGESVCHNATLNPDPECRQIEYGPSGCPSETSGVKVTRRGNMCYIIIDSEMEHNAARAYCRNMYGGRLLTVTNSTIMGYIASVLNQMNWAKDCQCFGCCLFTSARKVWIGLYYSDTWRWPDLAGVTPLYTRWRNGEGDTWIDDWKYQRCATLDGGYTWKWDDVRCDKSQYVICETYSDLL